MGTLAYIATHSLFSPCSLLPPITSSDTADFCTGGFDFRCPSGRGRYVEVGIKGI